MVATYVDKLYVKMKMKMKICLIDRPNLGGLARTSEIFAVDTLVVRSLKACKDQVFKSVGNDYDCDCEF